MAMPPKAETNTRSDAKSMIDPDRIDYWQVIELQDVPDAESQATRLIATDDTKEGCDRIARKRLGLNPDDPWPEGIKLEAVLLPQ